MTCIIFGITFWQWLDHNVSLKKSENFVYSLDLYLGIWKGGLLCNYDVNNYCVWKKDLIGNQTVCFSDKTKIFLNSDSDASLIFLIPTLMFWYKFEIKLHVCMFLQQQQNINWGEHFFFIVHGVLAIFVYILIFFFPMQ